MQADRTTCPNCSNTVFSWAWTTYWGKERYFVRCSKCNWVVQICREQPETIFTNLDKAERVFGHVPTDNPTDVGKE